MRLAFLAVLAACAAAAAGAGGAAPRVEDFTLACTLAEVGSGHHAFAVGVSPHAADPRGSRTILPATVRVSDTVYGPSHLVHVDTRHGVFVNRNRCTPSRQRVPLTRRGISGRPYAYVAAASCLLETKILVHARVVHGAAGKVASAAIAVRTARGRPIAYGLFRANGTALLYVTPSCDVST